MPQWKDSPPRFRFTDDELLLLKRTLAWVETLRNRWATEVRATECGGWSSATEDHDFVVLEAVSSIPAGVALLAAWGWGLPMPALGHGWFGSPGSIVTRMTLKPWLGALRRTDRQGELVVLQSRTEHGHGGFSPDVIVDPTTRMATLNAGSVHASHRRTVAVDTPTPTVLDDNVIHVHRLKSAKASHAHFASWPHQRDEREREVSNSLLGRLMW